MSEQLRIGIIGCGRIAVTRHIPELLAHPRAVLTALCDTRRARAAELAERYGVTGVYDTAEEMLRSAALDAVIICTPNWLHAEDTVNALRRGLHVFVEKPMAVSLEQCQLMIEEAERAGKVLAIGHNQRLHPVFRRAKEWLDSGRIGKVTQVMTQFQHGGPELWSVDGSESWFLNGSETGLGVLGDLGIHRLDMLRWMLADEITKVHALTSSVRGISGVNDSAALVLQTAAGVLGTVQVSWNNPLQEHRTVFYGTKGTLLFGETMDSITISDMDGSVVTETVALTLRKDGGMESGMVDDFIHSILEGRKPAVSGQEAYQSMKVLFEALSVGR